jgi:hypothetical protein
MRFSKLIRIRVQSRNRQVRVGEGQPFVLQWRCRKATSCR